MPATGIERALGNLEGTVQQMSDQWRRQEETASAGRRALYDRFEALSKQVTGIGSIAENVQQDVAELKNDLDEKVMPTIVAYNKEQDRKSGAKSFGNWLWVVIILPLFTAIGFVIHEAVIYFRGGNLPPH